jgi:hypothetical protein
MRAEAHELSRVKDLGTLRPDNKAFRGYLRCGGHRAHCRLHLKNDS